MKERDYKQPDFYHFSRDSIEFVEYLHLQFKGIEGLRVLDLCAGSGVIGIEFSILHQGVTELTFLEKQNEFVDDLNKNINEFIPHIATNIINDDFKNLLDTKGFDLVICNPPFYIEGTARKSKVVQRSKCHFFSETSMKDLFTIFEGFRAQGTIVLFLGRPDLPYIKKLEMEERIIFKKSIGKTAIYSVR
jgi:tRNA1(Val) A37 N6-methylase TrmN6